MQSTVALVAAFSIPAIAVGPASAASPDLSSITFDCDVHGYSSWEIPLYGSQVVITTVNCPTSYRVVDAEDTGNAVTPGHPVTSSGNDSFNEVTVDGEVSLIVYDDTAQQFANIDVVAPFDMPDPTGTQLANSSQEIPADAPSTTWGTPSQISANDEITIDNVDGCDILPGEHVYATQSFTVSTPGEFTFRVTGVDPLSHYFHGFGIEGSELDDPMVALYSTFNTRDTGNGVAGCNDDLNDLTFGGHDYGTNDYNRTVQGDFVEGHFSYFSTTLEPGEYMLVFTTWGDVSADAWAEETPEGGTVYFDVWGPSDGLTLTEVDPIADGPSNNNGSRSVSGPGLAFTGVDPTTGLWTASLLIVTGATIVFTRRRRGKSYE